MGLAAPELNSPGISAVSTLERLDLHSTPERGTSPLPRLRGRGWGMGLNDMTSTVRVDGCFHA